MLLRVDTKKLHKDEALMFWSIHTVRKGNEKVELVNNRTSWRS